MIDWRYWWRRYLGWFPVQFCMVCGKPYWGGLPSWGWSNDFYGDGKRVWINKWSAYMKDYCSTECHDIEVESLHEISCEFQDACDMEEHEEYDPLDYEDNYEGDGYD